MRACVSVRLRRRLVLIGSMNRNSVLQHTSVRAPHDFRRCVCQHVTMNRPAPRMPEPLPPETVAFVLSELGTIASAIEAAVREASPVYGEVLAAPEGIGLRLGVEQAIRAFLEAVGRGERPGAETDELWRRLGEAEFQSGRALDELRVAFRAGTRAAWRTAAELATR